MSFIARAKAKTSAAAAIIAANPATLASRRKPDLIVAGGKDFSKSWDKGWSKDGGPA